MTATRRAFLGFGLLAGAGALAPVVGRAGETDTGGSGTLSDEGRKRFRALVEALSELPGSPAEDDQAGKAADELAAVYEAGGPAFRAQIDDALDVLGDGFASDDRDGRLGSLRQRLRDFSTDGTTRSPAERTRDAIALGLAPFDPAGFRWTAAAADVWARTITTTDRQKSARYGSRRKTIGSNPPPAGTL